MCPANTEGLRLLEVVALAPEASTSCTEMTAAQSIFMFGASRRALRSMIAPIRAKVDMQRPSSGPGSGSARCGDVAGRVRRPWRHRW